MTDLQCPATAVLLDGACPPPAWTSRLRVAERFTVRGAGELTSLVDDSADLFRGETFVVAAPAEDVEEALRRRGVAGGAPVVVAVDSTGWQPLPAP